MSPCLNSTAWSTALPFRLAPRQELERHGEMLELLLLGIFHDRPGLRIGLQGHGLLVPADRLRLLLRRGGDTGKRPDVGAQIPGRFVILVSRHSKEQRRRGSYTAVTLESVVVYIVVGLIAGFLASRIVLGKG